MRQATLTIISQEEIAKKVYRLRLRGDVNGVSNPGQFVEIGLPELYLRRPISVSDVTDDVLTVIYKVVGKGTSVLSGMCVGDRLDVLLGLGNGYDLAAAGESPLLIGGGVGVPPLVWLAKALRKRGKEVRVIMGFNTREEVMLVDEMAAMGCRVDVMTIDGSAGKRGLVTDAMGDGYSYYYACGPRPMLRAVQAKANTKGEMSMEERMGCGFGICVGCTIETKMGKKQVCKDGPVFKGDELDLQ